MKQKITVTIDKDIVNLTEVLLKNKIFRNRSHLVEYLLHKLLKENNKEIEYGK